MQNTLPLQSGSQEELVVLRDLLHHLGAQSTEMLGGGGSPAHVLRIRTQQRTEFVLKYSFVGSGQVNGHDLASFRQKALQLQQIAKDAPLLRPFYIPILQQFHGMNWSAYVMLFYQGISLTTTLRTAGGNHQYFTQAFQQILQILIHAGYRIGSRPAPTQYFTRIHLERVERRQWILQRYLPADVLSGTMLTINHQRYIPALTLIAMLKQQEPFLQVLQPSALQYPIHGDANLGNFLVEKHPEQRHANTPGQQIVFKILDPRGTLTYMDACYDFAKMLFSLSLFEQAMEQGFVIRRHTAHTYGVRLRGGMPQNYIAAAQHFFDVLENVAEYRILTEGAFVEWRWRILFTHAIHMIAEAACRLSDQKIRTLGNSRGIAVCQELALGLYLGGTVLLNDLVHTFFSCQTPDLPMHLHALGPFYSLKEHAK